MYLMFSDLFAFKQNQSLQMNALIFQKDAAVKKRKV